MVSWRQSTPAQYRFLEKESADWVAKGILSPDSREELLQIYQPEKQREFWSRLAIWTLWSLGVLLLGLAVLLLISYHWSSLAAAGKLSLIFAVMGGSYFGGDKLVQKGSVVIGELLLFFGTLLLGVGFCQIVILFQAADFFPNGFWWWALGAFVVGWRTQTPIIPLLSMILWEIWLFETFWMNFRLEIFPMIWIIPLFAMAGYYRTYRFPTDSLVRTTLQCGWRLLVCLWLLQWSMCHFTYSGTAYYYLLIGVIVYLGEELFPAEKVSFVFRFLGLFVMGLALIPGTYRVYPEVDSLMWLNYGSGILFFVFLTGYLVFCGRLYSFGKKNAYLLLLALYAMLGGIWFLPEIWRQVFQNVWMFTFGLYFLLRGVQDVHFPTFLFGILYFLLWTVLRYQDLFQNAGVLGTAGLFFFCALILFGFSWFWRHFTRIPRGGAHEA